MSAANHLSNGRWTPLVVCPHKELGRGIRTALGERGVTDAAVLAAYPARGSTGDLGGAQACNVCFLDLATSVEEGLPLIRELAARMPVVVLNTTNDADLILRGLRSGACEFLSQPITAEQVGLVLERIAAMHASPESGTGGAVVCVIPGKAGCGATTFATHLAMSMHALGEKRVLLADLDPLAGTVGFLLKIKSEHQLHEILGNWKRMDPELWNRVVTAVQGVEVLPASETPAPLKLDRATVADMLGFWRHNYNAVVMDTCGAGSLTARSCAVLAEHVILVTTNELAALHATRRTLEWLEQDALDRKRVKLVLNRYEPGTGLKAEDVRKALGMEVFATLQNDYQAVQQAIWDGKPVAPSSSFAASTRRCAARLLGRGTSPNAGKGHWWKLFARRN